MQMVNMGWANGLTRHRMTKIVTRPGTPPSTYIWPR